MKPRSQTLAGLRVLAVHAHPDDESVCSGTLLARVAADGGRTSVITCTDGGAATIFGEGMATEENYRNQARIRAGELKQALDHLGVERRLTLPYHDSGMAGEAANDAPGSFHTAGMDDAVGRVVREIRAFRPQVMVTYPPDGGYGHPDHIKAYRVTMAAVEAAADPTRYPDLGAPWQVSSVRWSGMSRPTAAAVRERCIQAGVQDPFTSPAHSAYWTRALPDSAFDDVVDGRDIWASMVKPAVEAHRTQMPPDWPMLILPADDAAQAFGREGFVIGREYRKPSIAEMRLFQPALSARAPQSPAPQLEALRARRLARTLDLAGAEPGVV